MPLGHAYAPLGDMTPEFALSARYDLSVGCDRCRVSRSIDPLALAVARAMQPLRLIKFRCRVCGELGTVYATNNVGEVRTSFYAERPAWVKDGDWTP